MIMLKEAICSIDPPGHPYIALFQAKVQEDKAKREEKYEIARELESPEAYFFHHTYGRNALGYHELEYNEFRKIRKDLETAAKKGSNIALVAHASLLMNKYDEDLWKNNLVHTSIYKSEAKQLCKEALKLDDPSAYVLAAEMLKKNFMKANELPHNFYEKAKALRCPVFGDKKQKEKLIAAIQVLRDYGQDLSDEKNSKTTQAEGKKATDLADQLTEYATSFTSGKNDINLAAQDAASRNFTDAVSNGYREFKHRTQWRSILLNIVICATGVGLLALGAQLAINGRGFFSETTRGQKLKVIENIFKEIESDHNAYRRRQGPAQG